MLDWSIPSKGKRKTKVSVLQAKQTLVHIIKLRKCRSDAIVISPSVMRTMQ
jgi:hypothetical protein